MEEERILTIKYKQDVADFLAQNQMERILEEVLRTYGWYPYTSCYSNKERHINFQRLYKPEQEKKQKNQKNFLNIFKKMSDNKIFDE